MRSHIKTKSHKSLGLYLVQNYLQITPRRHTFAFLLGCTQPDLNPTTYLKGSMRSKWLRGHNWSNASRYMARLSRRLEKRSKLRLWDFYAMGKLIHYTVDAFTSSHNDHFPTQLQAHRQYENQLQIYFLEYLEQSGSIRIPATGSVMDAIRTYHEEYIAAPADIHRDSRYCVLVTSLIVCMLLA
ncbi:MAG: zinc dependent phospholipase C family protein [Oscillospiraceae bacterium]|nr:zinc dependent phospholipase C family protein [Oscillospiraceae bacterium]